MSIRRVGVLLSTEFLYGSKNYIFVFAIVAPIVISIVISLIFGTLFSEKPKLGIVDKDSSRLVTMIQELNSVESMEYGTVSEMKKAVENGAIDTGIVLPSGFDNSVTQGERTEIKAYIWGESLAKSRTVIGVTIANMVREMAGQEAPIEIETTTLGEEVSIPWSDRLLPFIVLMAVFLGGLLLPATSLATEKEKKTLGALVVTPASIGDIFLAKGMLGFILSLFMGILILVLNQAFGAKPIMLTVLLALGAIMATELGMMLGAYAKDFATIFTVWKSAGIILFAPAIIYLFPQIPGWIGRIFPTYYVSQPIVEISQLGGGWGDIALNTSVLIAIDIALIFILLFILRRKQYAIIGEK
jgi:ABC-2 type transport system permease protein